MNKLKKIRENRVNTIFLRGSANYAYIHTYKLTELEDLTIQAITTQGFTMLTINF